MREIKFRVWDEDAKRWLIGLSLENSLFFCWQAPMDSHGNLVWQQYTGHKDSDGKEIYEGDILEYTVGTSWSFENSEIETTPVFWGSYSDDEYVSNVECWMLNRNLPLSQAFRGGVGFGRGESVDTRKPIRVVGNIFEEAN